MDFNLTTFTLEVLNFLILIWLLKRFFYQPILTVIEARRAETAQMIADAQTVQLKAEAMKSEYAAHLAQMDKEYATVKTRIDEEIAIERTRRLSALEADIATERKRRETLDARERSELQRALERQALQLAARFATRLLDRMAGPELNARLADLALSELGSLTDDQQEALRSALRDIGSSIQVLSAYPLDAQQRTAFTQALSRLADRIVVPEYSEEANLKAGVCIMAGSWVLMANLRDELNFFGGNLEHGN